MLSCVQAIGLRENPIPYMAKADALLLPSRNEGKPMVVTESFIMGLVPIVTEYSSANEQIENGFDGLRKFFRNKSPVIFAGYGIGVKTASAVRHNNGKSQLAGVAAYRGEVVPAAVIVAQAVKKPNHRKLAAFRKFLVGKYDIQMHHFAKYS